MAKVNDKDKYPIKKKVAKTDILFGSDSENKYASANFAVGDIAEIVKNDIDLKVPTNTSQLRNDGDGVSPFVTEKVLDTALEHIVTGDIFVGVRNLVLKGDTVLNKPQGENKYGFGEHKLSRKLTAGKDYTFVWKGKTSAPEGMSVYQNGVKLDTITSKNEVVQTTNFKCIGSSDIILFYHSPNLPVAQNSDSTVDWSMVFDGKVSPPIDFMPAPEDVGKIIKDSEITQKEYVDAKDKAMQDKLALQDTALKNELTLKEAELLLKSENDKRELEAQLDRISESLTTNVEDLKKSVNDNSLKLLGSLDLLNATIQSKGVNVLLTEAELREITFQANQVESDYLNINYKINVLLRDQLLPREQKPILEQQQKDMRVKHNTLQNYLKTSLEDSKITQQEKNQNKANIDAFKQITKETNTLLLGMYDLIELEREDYLKKQVEESINEVKPFTEYSVDGKTNWHTVYQEGDIFMRVKNGVNGDWSKAIPVVGENGKDGNNGLNGQYQDYQFAKNKDLINPPTSGWQDAPPTANIDEYIWTRTGEVIPPAKEPAYWTAIRLSGPQGANGKDSVVIDLTNENSSVPATFEGNVEGTIPGTKAIVYEGTSIGAGWVFTADFAKAKGTINSTTGDVTVSSIVDEVTVIKIKATKQGYSVLEIDYTISKVRAGKPGNGESASVYYLVLSTNAIKVDNNNVATPSTVTAQVFVRVGAEEPQLSNTIIKYSYDGGAEALYNGPITVDKTKSTISFKAYSAEGKVLDSETAPILRDGKNGVDGKPGKDGIDGLQGEDGKNGIDGKTSYTHIAYADDDKGKNLSFTDSSKGYIGIYYDFIQANSTDVTKYSWSKWQGKDGDNGVPGKPGTDGRTPYFHQAWANSADGKTDFSTSASTGKTYMGTYSDFTQADSTDPLKYKWALIKGQDGSNGIDGKTSYTHIAYADTIAGGGFSQNSLGKSYIGMYVDFVQQDSSDPTKYKWSLIKGLDGKDGIPGKAGADGRTPYFHQAWANSEDGKTGFSTTVSKDKSFLGTYTDFVQADSTDPTKYKWSKIRGESIVSPTEPTGKYIGMVWIDTSKSPIEQKYWNGSTWILTGISQSDISKEVKKANDELKVTMDNALKDGIISNNEAIAISNNISTLNTTKRTLDSQYTVIYNDKNLSTAKKTDLQTKKSTFDVKHNALLAVCIKISKQTSVTPAEVADYNTKQAEYDVALTELSKSLEQAQNDIFINGINGIQIGGRNLLLRSANNHLVEESDYYESRLVEQLDNKSVKVTSTGIGNSVSAYGWFKIDVTNKLADDSVISGLIDFVLGVDVITDTSNWFISIGVRTLPGHINILTATLPLENTNGNPKRVYVKFKASEDGISRNSLLFSVGGAVVKNGTLIYEKIKIEKGTAESDWTPAIEDTQQQIDTAILNAAQAEKTANQAREKINFIDDAKFDGNSVIAGTVLLGDASGNNGLITGVTDKTNGESVRIGFGEGGYKNKNTLPFRVLHNGDLYAMRAFIKGRVEAESGFFGGFAIQANTIVSTNGVLKLDSNDGSISIIKPSTKKTAIRLGLDKNSEPAIEFFDDNGNVIWSNKQTGVVYYDRIPESYSKGGVFIKKATGGSYQPAWVVDLLENYLKKQTSYKEIVGGKWIKYIEAWYKLGGNSKTFYSYNAGNNEESHNNKQYEEFTFMSQNKLGAKVEDGWWLASDTKHHSYTNGMAMPGENPWDEPIYLPPETSNIESIGCYRYVNGKVVESKITKVLFEYSAGPQETKLTYTIL